MVRTPGMSELLSLKIILGDLKTTRSGSMKIVL